MPSQLFATFLHLYINIPGAYHININTKFLAVNENKAKYVSVLLSSF